MINYLEVLSNWLEQPHYLLAILIIVYMVAGTVDFIAGIANATFSKELEFSSRIAQLGVVRKLLILITMILVIPLALMLPFEIAIYSLSVLYVGIVVSEIYSVLGHAGLVKDGDKHNGIVAKLFSELFGKVSEKKD